ncbi:hypothetical protein DQP58_00060 [Mycobacterium colombiense]|uniref:Uncharacterized protein n=1 Tax=Mycobacterium colombiense TaxID=339268 RepID=A0A329KXZ1_9MYCO|nr:hypothetical protein [Mycobacterium colombiense]RAV00669.1 hypothetical protein DQP58_00060 [Mycobacterium colombiense]
MAWKEIKIKGSRFPLPSGGSVEITDDHPVSMGDGFTYQRLTYIDGTCEIVFEVHDGRPGAVSMNLRTAEGFIRQKDLAAIKLDQIRHEVYSVAGVGGFTADGDDYELTGADARKAVDRATSRRRLTPDLLRKVAETHQSAPAGERVAAVRGAFQVKERQALRYIAAAREKGFIDGND